MANNHAIFNQNHCCEEGHQATLKSKSVHDIFSGLYESLSFMQNCFGVAVASDQGLLPGHLLNGREITEELNRQGFGKSSDHLKLLDELAEQLNIDTRQQSIQIDG